MSHNFNNEERDPEFNDHPQHHERDKYNEENLSNTITYEEFDTFAHSNSNLIRENTQYIQQQSNLSPNQASNYENTVEENSVPLLRNRNLTSINPNTRINNIFSMNSVNSNNILIDNSNFNSNIVDPNIDVELSEEGGDSHRDFDNQLDEIFDNLNYLITSEK